MTRALAGLCVVLMAMLCSMPASAHEFRAGQLDVSVLDEAAGRYSLRLIAPARRAEDRAGGDGSSLRVIWPRWCTAAATTLDCGERGLGDGVVRVEGLGLDEDVVVRYRGAEPDAEPRWSAVLTAAAPEIRIGARNALPPKAATSHFMVRGIEHVLGGWDHLLFVMGMVWIVWSARLGRRARARRLVATITAFTLAHSVTLALSVFGAIAAPAAVVETVIAGSVLLLAVEATRANPDSVTARWPWSVAFVFGLVHGIGFAGALADLLGPLGQASDRVWALVGFNLGVEAGQLFVVAVLLTAFEATRRHAWARRLRLPTLYVMGTIAAYWTIERALMLGTAE